MQRRAADSAELHATFGAGTAQTWLNHTTARMRRRLTAKGALEPIANLVSEEKAPRKYWPLFMLHD